MVISSGIKYTKNALLDVIVKFGLDFSTGEYRMRDLQVIMHDNQGIPHSVYMHEGVIVFVLYRDDTIHLLTQDEVNKIIDDFPNPKSGKFVDRIEVKKITGQTIGLFSGRN